MGRSMAVEVGGPLRPPDGLRSPNARLTASTSARAAASSAPPMGRADRAVRRPPSDDRRAAGVGRRVGTDRCIATNDRARRDSGRPGSRRAIALSRPPPLAQTRRSWATLTASGAAPIPRRCSSVRREPHVDVPLRASLCSSSSARSAHARPRQAPAGTRGRSPARGSNRGAAPARPRSTGREGGAR